MPHWGFGPVSISIGGVSGVKGVYWVILVTVRSLSATAALQAVSRERRGGSDVPGVVVSTGG